MADTAHKTILIGVAIGVLSTIIGRWLVDLGWRSPEPQLTAEIEFGPLLIPPVFSTRLRALQTSVREDVKTIDQTHREFLSDLTSEEFAIAAMGAKASDNTGSAKRVYLKLVNDLIAKHDLFRNCKVVTPYGLITNQNQGDELFDLILLTQTFKGFWEVEIKNVGGAKAEEVSIDLPGAVHATITQAKKEPISCDITGSANIGTLGPRESAKVIAWTSFEPTRFATEQVIARHSSGLAENSIYLQTPAFWTTFSNWIRFGWVPLIFICIMALPICSALIETHIQSRIRAAINKSSLDNKNATLPAPKHIAPENVTQEGKPKRRKA